MSARPLLLLLLLTGCATGQPRPLHEPAPDSPFADPPPASQPAPGPGPTLPVLQRLPSHPSGTLPGGEACLGQLSEHAIPYERLPRRRGVETPIQITGDIGGIRYLPMAGHPLICDCRLALALVQAAPYLRNLGITEVHFSSAYSYRLMPSGKLSRHARGLAIDIHRVTANGEILRVQEDYQLALESGCDPDAPILNRMACLLHTRGFFDRVLTPDHDKSHYNHFHLAIISSQRWNRGRR